MEQTLSAPTIINPSDKKEATNLRKLMRGSVVVDDYDEQLKELFLSRNPKLKRNPKAADSEIKNFLKRKSQKIPFPKQGRWVYFQWNNNLIHLLESKEFFELRTARNRNLITKDEQKKFKKLKIGIAGLSVGNSVALNLGLEGAENMHLADFDQLALSNLNRIRAGVQYLGMNKALIAAQQIYELNPYAKLTLFPNGLEKNFGKFMKGLDVVIDEIDDVAVKIKIRLAAKKLRLPVVSAADNGDNTILDIQRFDLEPRRPIYHGNLKNINLKNLHQFSFAKKLELINKMVGFKYVTKRMKNSLALVGKSLYSWPQLGGAASLSGAAVVYAVRRIGLGMPMKSGKYDVNLDKTFGKK